MNANDTNSLKDILYRLVFVPKCASCRERLSPIVDKTVLNHGFPCLCDKCMEKWQGAKSQMCHTCFKPAGKCSCMPIKNTFVQPCIPSIFFYHPDVNRVESKVIYSLKHKKNRDLFAFIAEELAPSVEELLEELEISAGDCIFTYIPRTKKALKENGFNQGRYLARVLCSRVGGFCALPLLVREGGSEQKKLSKRERKKNVDSAIFVNTSMVGFGRFKADGGLSSLLSGKTVILTDDIITTGASLSRAIKVLRNAGAKTVIVCAAARSEISRDSAKENKK